MKKTVLGTALTLLMAAFTFTSCNSSEANNAEKTAPVENNVNKEQVVTADADNPVDTLNTKSAATKKEEKESGEKEEKDDKD